MPAIATITGAKIAISDEQHDEDERDHRDLVPAQPAPEQLHRRARSDLLRAVALLDDDRLVLGLVDEPDGIAGAHESDLTVGAAMIDDAVPPAVPGSSPAGRHERSPCPPVRRVIFPRTPRAAAAV